MGDHAKLSPSSAERWFACPGSINLIKTLPESAFKTSSYAAEGSVAHQLAEDFVSGKVDLLTLTSRVGETVLHDGHEIEITDAMVEGVIEYVDHIAAVKKQLKKPGGVVGKAEVRVTVRSLGEIPDAVYGTADYLLYQKGNELHVFDFKFGKGVVEAEENKQGLIYVVGAQDEEAGHVFDKVFFHVVQPRARHNEGSVRPWELPKGRVAAFRKELEAAVKRTQDPKAPRTAGPWCKYCPAMGYCPEVARGVQLAAQTEFTKIPAPPSKEVGQAQLPVVAMLTPEQVARALDWEDSIDHWFEALRARALEDLTRDATLIPGYKLVEQKTNRAWPDERTIEAAFAMLGEDLWNKKLKSPAQLEKLVGKEEVAKYAVKPLGKPTIVKSSDKREAIVAAGKAGDVFGVWPQGGENIFGAGGEAGAADEDIFGDLAAPPVAAKTPFWP